LAGSALVFLISHTFTRPLASLVAGVRALETGDFSYPLESSGGDEVTEVTDAFVRMRAHMEKSQGEQKQLEERLRPGSQDGSSGQTRGRVSARFQ